MSMRVPFAPSSVPLARRGLHDWLECRNAPKDRMDDARIVVSELVANAIRHATPLDDGSIEVSWQVQDDRDLQISVTDGGAETSPGRVSVPVSATSGRGLAIIEMMVTDWWLERAPARTTVHTVLPLY